MHNCEVKKCKHEHIKFCPKCLEPYCKDCGKVWAEPCTLNHFPNYIINYPTGEKPTIPYSPWYVGDPPNEVYKITCGVHQDGVKTNIPDYGISSISFGNSQQDCGTTLTCNHN